MGDAQSVGDPILTLAFFVGRGSYISLARRGWRGRTLIGSSSDYRIYWRVAVPCITVTQAPEGDCTSFWKVYEFFDTKVKL